MVLMGSGVPAFILFIWIFVRIVSTLTRQWRWSTAAETQGLLMAVAVVTVGFATRNLFDYMFAGSLAHLFWILVAAGLCSVRPQIELPPINQIKSGDRIPTENGGGVAENVCRRNYALTVDIERQRWVLLSSYRSQNAGMVGARAVPCHTSKSHH